MSCRPWLPPWRPAPPTQTRRTPPRRRDRGHASVQQLAQQLGPRARLLAKAAVVVPRRPDVEAAEPPVATDDRRREGLGDASDGVVRHAHLGCRLRDGADGRKLKVAHLGAEGGELPEGAVAELAVGSRGDRQKVKCVRGRDPLSPRFSRRVCGGATH